MAIVTLLVFVVAAALAVGLGVLLVKLVKDGSRRDRTREAAKTVNLGPDQNLGNLHAGDILALWDGKETVVERIVDCRETMPERVAHWKWAFLEGGQLLSIAPSAQTLYTDSVVLYQGSLEFEQLTGEIDNGGALKTFEARVREGISGSHPVFFEYGGQTYRVLSTGTFGVADQPVPEAEVWCDVQVDEGQNVYFRLAGGDGAQALGVWTSHIVLYTGRALETSDVREIYHVER